MAEPTLYGLTETEISEMCAELAAKERALLNLQHRFEVWRHHVDVAAKAGDRYFSDDWTPEDRLDYREACSRLLGSSECFARHIEEALS